MNNTNNLQNLRKINKLKIQFLDIDLANIKNKHKVYNVKYKLFQQSGYLLDKELHSICKEHYQKYSELEWKLFIAYWFKHKITNIVIAYTIYNKNIEICGLLMYIKKPIYNEIYIRLLCSNIYCGGDLLRYMINIYNDNIEYKRILLNSEKEAVKFYQKNGFFLTNGFYMNIYGKKYPLLIYPTKKDVRYVLQSSDIIKTSFWPGISYYIYKYFWYIVIIGFCLFIIVLI